MDFSLLRNPVHIDVVEEHVAEKRPMRISELKPFGVDYGYAKPNMCNMIVLDGMAIRVAGGEEVYWERMVGRA